MIPGRSGGVTSEPCDTRKKPRNPPVWLKPLSNPNTRSRRRRATSYARAMDHHSSFYASYFHATVAENIHLKYLLHQTHAHDHGVDRLVEALTIVLDSRGVGGAQERGDAVVERERAMEEREGAVEERERAVEARERAMEEREGSVEERERAIEERKGAVEERERAAEERARSTEERERAVEGREMSAVVHQLFVAEREARERALQCEIDTLRAESASLSEAKRDLERARRDAASSEELQRENELLRGSVSRSAESATRLEARLRKVQEGREKDSVASKRLSSTIRDLTRLLKESEKTSLLKDEVVASERAQRRTAEEKAARCIIRVEELTLLVEERNRIIGSSDRTIELARAEFSASMGAVHAQYIAKAEELRKLFVSKGGAVSNARMALETGELVSSITRAKESIYTFREAVPATFAEIVVGEPFDSPARRSMYVAQTRVLQLTETIASFLCAEEKRSNDMLFQAIAAIDAAKKRVIEKTSEAGQVIRAFQERAPLLDVIFDDGSSIRKLMWELLECMSVLPGSPEVAVANNTFVILQTEFELARDVYRGSNSVGEKLD